MKTLANSPGRAVIIPAQIIFELRPRAFQVINHLLLQCDPKMPEVQIDQRQLGQELGIHQDTAGRWVRYLETTGKLSFSGYCEHGRRKRYRINLEWQNAD